MTLIIRLTAAFAVVLFAMLAVAPLPAEGQGSAEQDRAALVALYNATDGPNWRRADNWLSDEPLEEWHGVSAVRYGREHRVWRIELDFNNLSGSIPPEIRNLTRLRVLSLPNNNLSGPIPELDNIAMREATPRIGPRVHLQFNNLSGPIPSSFGRMRYADINIRENNLSGPIPPELGSMLDSVMNFSSNNIGGPIPPELGNLRGSGDHGDPRGTTQLIFNKNSIGGTIPPELGNMRNVNVQFNDNNIIGMFPRTLGNIDFQGKGGKSSVHFWSNYLDGPIPSELCDGDREVEGFFGSLQEDRPELKCEGSAPGPSDAADRAILEAFYDATGGANWNNNDGWKTDFPLTNWHGVTTRVVDGVIRVTWLSLPFNNLTGEIPRELADLPNLAQLALYENNLTGTIPEGLRRFEGSINPQRGGVRLPIEEGTVSPDPVDSAADRAILEAFYDATGGDNWSIDAGWKSDSPLSGWYGVTVTAPAGGDADNHEVRVTGVSLPNNNLTGQIPRELADLPLETLVLNGNNLTGTIPEGLRRFEGTINPQRGGVNLPVGTPVPALPFIGTLLLACGLYVMGRRKMLRLH